MYTVENEDLAIPHSIPCVLIYVLFIFYSSGILNVTLGSVCVRGERQTDRDREREKSKMIPQFLT